MNKAMLCWFLYSLALAGAPKVPKFSARRDYGNERCGPCGIVAVGDLRASGRTDVVTVSYVTVQTMLANGDGTFALGPKVQEGRDYIKNIVLGVLTRARTADLIFSNDSLGVALGDGKGGFAPAVFYPTSDKNGSDSGPGEVAVGDFNGDGKLDAVIPGVEGIWFFEGKGNGEFKQAVLDPVGNFLQASIMAADFDRDGKLDLAVATAGSGSVMTVLLGKGDGTFSATQSYSPPNGGWIYWLAAGDLNQDGYPDLALGMRGGNVNLLINNANGSFTQAAAPAVPCGPVAIGDVDGDGFPDLVCDGFVNGLAYVAFGLGNGQLAPPVSYAVENSLALNMALAPLRDGGPLDVIAGQTDGISILRNNGHGKFPDGNWTSVQGTGDCGAAADFNGDGKPDFAVLDGQGITILFGTGKIDAPFSVGPTIQVSGAACPIAGDLNGDGIPDILVGADGLGGVGAYLGNGDGTFRLAGVTTGIAPAYDLALGDINHDGVPDFLTSGNQMALGNGNGTFQAPTAIAPNAPGDCCLFVATGDLNNDGWTDVALTNGNSVVVELNNHEGGFTQSLFGGPSGAASVIFIDLNNDGNLDAVVSGPNSVDTFLGNGQGGFTLSTERIWYPGPDNLIAWAADVNGDGFPDILLPANASIGIALGNGDGTFQPFFAIGGGPGEGRILTENLHGQQPSAGVPDIVAPDGTGIGVLVLRNLTK